MLKLWQPLGAWLARSKDSRGAAGMHVLYKSHFASGWKALQ